MLQVFAKMLRPLSSRIANMVSRGVVSAVDDAKKMQIVQLDLLKTEVRSDLERVQNYGFTSVPFKGAEAAVVFVGGHRDHGLVLAIDDRRYRLKGLTEGEVAMYDDTGSKIVFKRSGDIEIVPSSGKVKVTGDLEASGDVKAGSISLTSHTHAAGALVTGASAGAPVTGTTGAPL